jgi:hypothetical protein
MCENWEPVVGWVGREREKWPTDETGGNNMISDVCSSPHCLEWFTSLWRVGHSRTSSWTLLHSLTCLRLRFHSCSSSADRIWSAVGAAPRRVVGAGAAAAGVVVSAATAVVNLRDGPVKYIRSSTHTKRTAFRSVAACHLALANPPATADDCADTSDTSTVARLDSDLVHAMVGRWDVRGDRPNDDDDDAEMAGGSHSHFFGTDGDKPPPSDGSDPWCAK